MGHAHSIQSTVATDMTEILAIALFITFGILLLDKILNR